MSGPHWAMDPEWAAMMRLQLALDDAALAIDATVAILLEPGVADRAVAAGVSPLLGVDCAWWSQQLRSASLLLRGPRGLELDP